MKRIFGILGYEQNLWKAVPFSQNDVSDPLKIKGKVLC